MNFLPKLSPRDSTQQDAEDYNALLRYAAKIGGQLFGPIPKGRRREFFNLDKHTWVWHEEWIDEDGQRQVVMTQYHVRPDGILKSQGDQTYRRIGHAELHNLYQAVELYGEAVPAALERLLQRA
jgi:hypothetical protein